MTKRDVFFIQVGHTGSVFVKTLEFFRAQGGFEETWGLAWKPIVAESIEHARYLGCEEPGARPYIQQAAYDPEIADRYRGR